MLILVLFAVLEQAVPEPLVRPETHLIWGEPCVVQANDITHRIDRAVKEMLHTAGLPTAVVVRCVQPAGANYAIFMSDQPRAHVFIVFYNEEADAFYSDLAIRGLAAHEVAHEMLGQSCRDLADVDAENDCEAEIDGAAAGLAGAAAVRAALEEYHRLFIRLMAQSLARVRDRLDRRQRILQRRAP